jgi:hypothetical protein
MTPSKLSAIFTKNFQTYRETPTSHITATTQKKTPKNQKKNDDDYLRWLNTLFSQRSKS